MTKSIEEMISEEICSELIEGSVALNPADFEDETTVPYFIGLNRQPKEYIWVEGIPVPMSK